MRIGLTGGIAAGKSTVAGYLGAQGVALVDADRVARDLVVPGAPALVELVRVFGREILKANGELDRHVLGALVFRDGQLRQRLEAILHPAIAAESQRLFAELEGRGEAWVVYEAALLIESGRHHEMDKVIVVVADDAVRVRRLMKREGIGEADAQQRISLQWPQERRVALADYVIDNSFGCAQTECQIAEIWLKLTQDFPR